MRIHSWQEWRLFAHAARNLLEARLRLRFTSIEAMRSWSCRIGKGAAPYDQVVQAYHRARRRLGGTCLVRALALQRLLSRYGYHSELRIGVARTARGFEAHAWLTVGDVILEGEGQEAAEFRVLTNWPAERRG